MWLGIFQDCPYEACSVSLYQCELDLTARVFILIVQHFPVSLLWKHTSCQLVKGGWFSPSLIWCDFHEENTTESMAMVYMAGSGLRGWKWFTWLAVVLCGWQWFAWLAVAYVAGSGLCGWQWFTWLVLLTSQLIRSNTVTQLAFPLCIQSRTLFCRKILPHT